MLHTDQRKILGCMYGQIQEKGQVSLRSNSDIYGFYKDLNIVDDIKIRRLVWTSHIIRMEEKRIKKRSS